MSTTQPRSVPSVVAAQLPGFDGDTRVVRRVGTASVVRLVLGLSLSLSAVLLGGLLGLSLLAAASGAMESVNGFLAAIGLDRVNVAAVLAGLALVLIVLSVLVTAVAGLTAALFNALADVVGGVRVTVRRRGG